MKTKLAILVVILLLCPLVTAGIDYNVEDVASKIKGKSLPMPLNLFISDERINVQIELVNSENLDLGLLIKDDQIIDLKSVWLDNPTISIFTKQKTIETIYQAEDPFVAVREEISEGNIKFEAHGLLKSLKFFFLSIFVNQADVESVEEVAENKDSSNEVTGQVISDIKTEAETTGTESIETDTKVTEEVKEAEEKVEVPKEVETPKKVVKKVTGPKTHFVEMINTGFEVNSITIKVGDTVTWDNVRDGQYNLAMIIGAQQCTKVKSKMYGAGESYSFTFDKAETCTIVDGIMTTQIMKVVIE
jgi:plastocyanin